MANWAPWKMNPQEITVTGVVSPGAWDDEEQVTELMVEWSSPDEDEPLDLLLDLGYSGRALQRFVGRHVAATGVITMNEDGDPVMLVSDLRLYRPRGGRRLAS